MWGIDASHAIYSTPESACTSNRFYDGVFIDAYYVNISARNCRWVSSSSGNTIVSGTVYAYDVSSSSSSSSAACPVGHEGAFSYFGKDASTACIGGCMFHLIASITTVVDGQYFTAGDWTTTGASCSDPSGTVYGGTQAPTSCPSGQTLGQVNGVNTCVNSGSASSGSGTSSGSASSGSGTSSGSGSSGSASSGDSSSGSGSGSNSSGGSGSNSSGNASSGSASSGSSSSSAGEGASTSDLYEKKTLTVNQVFTDFKTGITAAPVYSSLSNYLNVGSVGGGSCPSWSLSIPYLETSISIDQFCSSAARNMLLIAKSVLLLVAAFCAFRVAAY
jgi:hypothetical protein